MKNSILILTFVIFSISNISAQITLTRQKSFGGDGGDYMPKLLKVGDSFFIAGSSGSGVSWDKTEPSRGIDDFWILKCDSLYNIIWQRTIGGNHYDVFSDIILTSDSSIMLFGTSCSDISGEKSENTYGECDYWMVKLDMSGAIIWQKTIGGAGYESASSIMELNDGTFLLAGYSKSDSSGLKTEDSRGYYDYWLLRMDNQGNILWDKTYGGSEFDFLGGMTVMNDSLIILTGKSNSPASGEKTQNPYGNYDFWVVCTDLNGTILWDKTLGGNGIEYNCYPLTSGNYIYIFGTSESNISGVKSENSRGENDVWIIKLDINGNIIWDKTIGGNSYDGVSSGYISQNGSIILACGSSSGISGEKTEPLRGVHDYWIIAIDTTGNILWQKTFGGTLGEVSTSILEFSNGKYLIVGYSESGVSGDKTSFNKGGDDFWLIEFEVGTGIAKNTGYRNIINLFPNPANDIITIHIESESTILGTSITDIHGQHIRNIELQQNRGKVDVSDLTSGVYIIRINFQDDQVIVKRFVKL